jgi:small-conductance mechanosensitive channel
VVRIVKSVVIGATAILAVNQLGVDTTIINLAVASLLFSLGATFTLVAALGTRQLAGHVAAGRYVRRIVPVGAELIEPVSGTVVKVHPATVEIRRPDGSTVHIPNETLLTGSLQLRRPE